jgi:hypothetical protein
VEIWKNVAVEGAYKVHFSSRRNATDLKYSELFLFHSPQSWFEYGAGFRISKLNTYPGWEQENRVMINAGFKKAYLKNKFKLTNQLEYRSFENFFHHFRYKQEFLIKSPILTNWGMHFYLAEQAFLKLNRVGLHLARFFVGISAVEQKHFAIKMYYGLEKYKLINTWKTGDILGLNMSFMF